MASITKGWSTSFIFKQDLTSYYMNSLLRSVIRPGIYNANMALGYGTPTVGSGMGTGGSLCLFIKEGTTFVFSNDYVYDESLGYRRNFCDFSSKVGGIADNENSCIIKSVTLSDISVGLGNGYDPGLYSIHAYIRYNPLDANNLDTSSPTFILVNEENEEEEEEESESSYLYDIQSDRYPSNSEAGASILDNKSHAIFDGAKIDDANAEWPLSYYLNLGFVRLGENNTVTMFTGRGLPEYRYTQSMDSSIMSPDMIPDVSGNMKGLYFDIPKTFIGTTLIEKRIDSKNSGSLNSNFNWEAAYLGSRRPNSVTVPVIFSSNEDNDGDNYGGIYAVYGLVSNIRSFGTVQGNIPSIKDSSIIFDKLKLSNSHLSINEEDSWIKDSNSVPLDISVLNVEGLLNNSIIKGKDIWSYVIDNIRKNGNPSNITDVVPVGVVSVDKHGKVIPELSFSYFGLQSRLPRVNVLNIREHNIFNVIPVME